MFVISIITPSFLIQGLSRIIRWFSNCIICKKIRLSVLVLTVSVRSIAWVISLVARLLNPCIYFSFIRRCSSILWTWQSVFSNSCLIKLYLVIQVSVNIVAIILFSSIQCIVNRLPQKRSFDGKDENIISFLPYLRKGLLFSRYFSALYNYLYYFCEWYYLCNTLRTVNHYISLLLI